MIDQSNVPKQFRIEFKSNIKSLKSGQHYTDGVNRYTVFKVPNIDGEMLVVNWSNYSTINYGKENVLVHLNIFGIEKTELDFEYVPVDEFKVENGCSYLLSDGNNIVIVGHSGDERNGLCKVLNMKKYTCHTMTNMDMNKLIREMCSQKYHLMVK